jgi:hypothetical protein
MTSVSGGGHPSPAWRDLRGRCVAVGRTVERPAPAPPKACRLGLSQLLGPSTAPARRVSASRAALRAPMSRCLRSSEALALVRHKVVTRVFRLTVKSALGQRIEPDERAQGGGTGGAGGRRETGGKVGPAGADRRNGRPGGADRAVRVDSSGSAGGKRWPVWPAADTSIERSTRTAATTERLGGSTDRAHRGQGRADGPARRRGDAPSNGVMVSGGNRVPAEHPGRLRRPVPG